MARKFLTALDLNKNELQNGVIQNLAAAPSSPVKGQLYMDSVANILYWWDGTKWVSAVGGAIAFGPVVPETTFGGTASDGVAVTAARSDHKHANPVHDAAAHSTIPLNSFAPATGMVNAGLQNIINLATPVGPNDAVNKAYADNLGTGMAWKEPVRAASTANVNIATGGLVAVDGVTTVNLDRILLKNQTNATENGIYFAQTGSWVRAIDADSGTDLEAAAVFVMEGTTLADTAWVNTANAPIVPGTTTITFVQFAGAGVVTAGAGLTQSGNTINVAAADATITVTADAIARAALTGDVTTVVNAATIANGVVTNAKLATMPANTIKGNNTGATAAPVDMTVAQLKTLIGSTSKFTQATIGGATSQVVTHNLNSQAVVVSVYRTLTPWEEIECDIEHTSVNTVTLRFSVAPAANEYTVVVIG